MSMASQQHMEKMQLRQNYRNFWHTDLTSTITADTPYCCFAFWCGPLVSYLLRKRALYDDMSRYTCCAGYMPCSGRCGESKCPEACLATEVLCCFGNSVASTRFLLQDEFNIQTTQCDNCIIGFMFCLSQVACVFSIIAMVIGSSEIQEAAQLLNCLADMVYCTVCACMQTQHKVEMDKRDGVFGPQVMAVPPSQQMSRLDQPYPASVGYPQPAYGYPSSGYQRYTCCAGYMPCSGRYGESKCPEACLATEVLCCFGNSVASTRFLLQDEFNIQTTQCDNCIIGFMLCLSQVACVFSIIAMVIGSSEIQEAAQLLNCLADMVYCTVCACMQTQHKVEMDKRDGMFGPQVMAVPPSQQMSRLDQPYPASVGYPQPAYGYPSSGYQR